MAVLPEVDDVAAGARAREPRPAGSSCTRRDGGPIGSQSCRSRGRTTRTGDPRRAVGAGLGPAATRRRRSCTSPATRSAPRTWLGVERHAASVGDDDRVARLEQRVQLGEQRGRRAVRVGLASDAVLAPPPAVAEQRAERIRAGIDRSVTSKVCTWSRLRYAVNPGVSSCVADAAAVEECLVDAVRGDAQRRRAHRAARRGTRRRDGEPGAGRRGPRLPRPARSSARSIDPAKGSRGSCLLRARGAWVVGGGTDGALEAVGSACQRCGSSVRKGHPRGTTFGHRHVERESGRFALPADGRVAERRAMGRGGPREAAADERLHVEGAVARAPGARPATRRWRKSATAPNA